jgi:hypothetical protein
MPDKGKIPSIRSSGGEIVHPYPGYGLSRRRWPLFSIAITLFYYDQRIRREGYHVERMMDAAGLNPTAPLQPAETSPPQSNPEASEA